MIQCRSRLSYAIVKEQAQLTYRAVVEITGIEPVTSGLQSRRSPS